VDRSVTHLYREHASFVELVLRRSGVAGRDLADATQDVFIVAHRRFSEFEGRSSPRTWLYRIAWNVASEYRRRAFRRRELLDDSVDPGGEAESLHEELETQRSVSALLDAIDRLDADKREALICHELEEQPMIAVARRLGIPLKTAFSRLYAARRALKLELSKQGWACIPLWGWPFRRLLERGVARVERGVARVELAPSPLRFGAVAGRALVAVAFVGLVPAQPTHTVRDVLADAPPPERVVFADVEPVAPQLERADAPQPFERRAVKPRGRLPSVAATRPAVVAAEAELEPRAPELTVIRAGHFDLGAGPFGESPLADPPQVAPQHHPRARLRF
jgi:RNA polymerase sigma-70 factor (ECF subfamily)